MWKHTWYCQKGISHATLGSECQDRVKVTENEGCIVAALADGLGSLKCSEMAADVATTAVCEWFVSFHGYITEILAGEGKQVLAQKLICEIQMKISEQAAVNGLRIEDMDCTLAFVYISKRDHYAVIGQLGDSAVCIIKRNTYLVINGGNHTANGTDAVLVRDAHQKMKIMCMDLNAEKIFGFILTSDGLENEIYTKNSAYINKAAEKYFNILVSSEDPQAVLAKKIEELTKEIPEFDDDISIAVISCADEELIFPDDPTWLCSCGKRNRLQDTYCAKCSKDFVKLYRNVSFKEHGGKYAYFRKINKRLSKEYEVLGIVPPWKKRARRLRILIAVLCFILGMAIGAMAVSGIYAMEIQKLKQQNAALLEGVCEQKNPCVEAIEPFMPEEELSIPTEKDKIIHNMDTVVSPEDTAPCTETEE